MAMMMTGRVLLVCALCVLWCGAGGRCDEEDTAGSGNDVQLRPELKQLENSPQDTQGLPNGAPGVNENVPHALSIPREEEDNEEDSEESEREETEAEKKSIEGQSDQRGTTAPDPGSRHKNLIGTEQQKGQSIVSAEDISHSGSRESNANPTQTKIEEKKDVYKNTPAIENALTTVNGENSLPAGIAGGNSPPPPEDSADSREQDGEDTTSEGEKKVPPPDTAATPQSHRDEGSEGTGEDTKATTVTANTTDTTNTQSSDGSTAVLPHHLPSFASSCCCVCGCGCGGGRVRVREREPCTARTHTRPSLTLCVCPLAWTLALTSPHEGHT
ncbi:mucin-associated surface protein (MASP) [Trypanosoma cruzi]|nr:mucin-associated surface protein (MASP) [Trypanosoma cruzi]